MCVVFCLASFVERPVLSGFMAALKQSYIKTREQFSAQNSYATRRHCLNASAGYFSFGFYWFNVLLQVHGAVT
jgi:hypothetical protein